MQSTMFRRALTAAATLIAVTSTAVLAGCSDSSAPTAPRPAGAVSPDIRIGGLSITITDGPIALSVGQQATYVAVATDFRGRQLPQDAVTWLSGKPGVVRMNGNVATPLKAGTATIFAIFYGGIAERKVTVTVAPPAPTHMLVNYQLRVDTLGRPSLINSDGSNEQLLLSFEPGYHHFDLSPDRTRLTFAKAFDNRIFTSASDGSGIQVLVPSNVNYVPRWSSDGRMIVWVREVTIGAPSREIFTMDASGTNQVQLTFNGSEDNAPMFAPDRSKIVFQSNRSGNYDIWVMNVDGTNQLSLAASPATDGGPSWSPDGARIAFLSDRSGSTQVFSMSPDGTDVRQLTTLTGIRSDVTPIWAPDGSRIAFGRTIDAQGSAWLINPDGSQLAQFRTPDPSRTWEFITSWRN